MIIYKITNKVNGKVYIGQTIQTLKARWSSHCTDKKGYCRLLHNAILKYGRENFTVEQIDVALDRDELDKKEIYWINFYDSINHKKGYNLLGGGNKNHSVSEETRKLLSKSGKGRKCPEHLKKLLSSLKKGVKRPLSVVEKMRNTAIKTGCRKGANNYSYGRKGSLSPVARKIVNVTLNKEFDTATEAAIFCGAKDCSTIIKCCKGKRKTAYGYSWRYANG